MANGKRTLHSYNNDIYDDEEVSKRKLIIITAIAVIIIAIVAGVILFKNDSKSPNELVAQNTINTNQNANQMISVYQGYDVLGKIVIDKYKVEQYILDSKEDKALDCGVIKLYGGTLNNYGNFCIAGHNKAGVFEKLSEMDVGDSFKIIEPNLTETKYQITEIYSSEAENLNCLLQDDEKIEITLITCENASTTRLIVKAEEM